MKAFQYVNIIVHIATKKPSQAFIDALSVDVVKAICEVALNTRLGHIPLTSEQAQALKKHARAIKVLSLRSVSIKRKRKLLKLRLLQDLLTPAIARLQHGQANEVGAGYVD